MGSILSETNRAKRLMRYLFFLLVFILNAGSLNGQDSTDYYQPRVLSFEDRTYVPYIKTVILEKQGTPLSLPVINLNSEDKLELKFDLLGDEIRTYSYKIIHCTPQWEPSILSENDYIDGFYTDQISDYKHSLNTLQPYWHYRLEFPNQQMRPLLSGNYLMIVFDNIHPDSVILTRRFYVLNQRLGFKTNIHRSTLIENRNSHQEADFSILVNGLPVSNPYGDIDVIIQQNRDPNFTIQGLRPVFANGESLDYNHDDINNFEGGSEYRNIDLRTTRFLTQFVEQFGTDTISKLTTVLAKPDIRRNTMRYTADNDINGNYIIKIYEGRDANLEGDYLWVTFRLKGPENFTQAPIYIEGAFTEYALRNLYRLNFNPESNYFEKTFLLKQGYYNYRFLTLPQSGKATQIETEGNHYETLNEYYFLAYWKEAGTRYAQLVGLHLATAGGF